jgi:hypothetical protein
MGGKQSELLKVRTEVVLQDRELACDISSASGSRIWCCRKNSRLPRITRCGAKLT